MRTALLQISDPAPPGTGFPVRLFLLDAAGSIPAEPLAAGELPADWQALDPPPDPDTGEPILDPARMRGLVLDTLGSSPTLEAIGRFLYRLLAAAGVTETWQELRPGGLRTVLDLRSGALAKAPWELLVHSPLPLFADPACPLLRGRLSQAPAACREHLPLRVLVVLACAQDDPDIEWRAELWSIEAALNRLQQEVDFEVLVRPSRQQLAARWRDLKPHVLHFIGHGRAGKAGGAPCLELFSDATGTASPWRGGDIAADLLPHPPRLAVLNACHSAEEPDREGAWSLSRTFLELGSAAVLGMHGAVPGNVAATFGAVLYRQLARGCCVDAAVAEARLEVSRLPEMVDGFQHRDWSLACLTVAELPERVLPVRARPQALRQLDASPKLALLAAFVDRTEERRKVWRNLTPEAQPRPLVIVRGEADGKVGKTWMLLWCLRACAGQGHQVAYRDFRGEKALDFLEALRALRDGDADPELPLHRALEPAAFYSFNRTVNTLLSGQPAAPVLPVMAAGQPCPPTADAGAPLTTGPQELLQQLGSAFRAGLEAAAAGQPLTLGLDHLTAPLGQAGGLSADALQQLRRGLLGPVARGEVPGVRLLLAVNRQEYEALGLPQLEHLAEVLAVRSFSTAEYIRLLVDYLTLFGKPRQELEAVAPALVAFGQEPWLPEKLRQLADSLSLPQLPPEVVP